MKRCSLAVWLFPWSALASSWSPGCLPLGFVEPRVSSAVNQPPHPTEKKQYLYKGEVDVTVYDLALKEESLGGRAVCYWTCVAWSATRSED